MEAKWIQAKMMDCPKCGLHGLITVSRGLCDPCFAWNETEEQMQDRIRRWGPNGTGATKTVTTKWERRPGDGVWVEVREEAK